MSKKTISVVIPTFNGKELLEENIPFLLESLDSENIEYEILICDDCSTDDTIAFIENNYPSFIVLANKINKGFSPTINLGIFEATNDLIFVLNNDVKMTPHYFGSQFPYFDNPNTFGVMGKIVGTSGETQDTAKFPHIEGLKIKGSQNYEIIEEENSLQIYSFMLSGANSLIDRKKIQLLQGFDEIYAPFYWEDVDLSLRAWRLGWECFYEPSSVCIHPTSTTISKLFKKKAVNIISDRNKFIFHRLHLDTKKQFIYRQKLFFKFLSCALIFRIQYLKSYLSFLRKSQEIKKSKEKLNLLKNETGCLLSLEEVKNKILQKIGQSKIKKF